MSLALTNRLRHPRVILGLLTLLLSCLACPVAFVCQTQAQNPPGPTGDITLHVYTNLVELPVLVLDRSLAPVPSIAPEHFELSLDRGPLFHPSYVRREGDDPVDLAILIDVRGNRLAHEPTLAEAVATLAPDLARTHSRLALFALDCTLMRKLVADPGSPEQIRDGVAAVLKPAASLDPHGKHLPCRDPVHLWDAMGYITQQLSGYSGRHVLLALSNGDDTGSTTHLSPLEQFANGKSVTVFGMAETYAPLAGGMQGEPWLSLLAQGSGGIVLRSRPRSLSAAFPNFMRLLRERYIIDFPRANTFAGGLVQIDVSVREKNTIALCTGASVPLADPSIAADPNTVPSDPTRAPALGSHRAIQPQP